MKRQSKLNRENLYHNKGTPMKEEISKYIKKIKNNWIVKLIKLLIGLAVILILTQFIFILLIKLIPHSFVQYAMSANNDNSTIAEMHISVADNLLLFAITCVYAIFTWYLVSESKKAIAQSKREQHIRDIENRLEKFYIPADDIINLKNRHKERTINGFKRNTDNQFVQGLQHLRKYSYLADKATYEAYEKYMSTECTKPKSTTCMDKYGEFHYCDHHEYNCHNQWSTCKYNLEYCEYNPDCEKTDDSKRKDHTKCTLENSNCKYIKDLKNKITKDIEDYKNELLRLKE